jgi:hypothetical protein
LDWNTKKEKGFLNQLRQAEFISAFQDPETGSG